jgi:hypothetical protein
LKENLIPYFGDSKGKIGKIKSFGGPSIGRLTGGLQRSRPAGGSHSSRQQGGNYINNTCLHNKYFDLQYPIDGYIYNSLIKNV